MQRIFDSLCHYRIFKFDVSRNYEMILKFLYILEHFIKNNASRCFS
jgi:hypothetical protein